ncbi:hypothetical protein [Natrialba swarupiae]|uniref:Uncharacterized protein n=1 Tax=Natrialba swarupiae TaxID=2448032 RepID=A0A5D5ASZ2_9EURY|nr:hypothetical protein [Natrialba swarupiae]TYT62982.1 hypothetical protein FYC77_04875 [Natrialba swarupiae]
MSDERNSISRRNVLPGLGTAGIGAAPVGAGTNAMFSDDVEFEDDQLVTGELDLKLDWQQHYLGPTDEWEFVNAHPDDEGDGEQSIGEKRVLDDDIEVDGPFYTYTQNGSRNFDDDVLEYCGLDYDYDFGDQNTLIGLGVPAMSDTTH